MKLEQKWRDAAARAGWTLLQTLIGIAVGPEIVDLAEETLQVKAPWAVVFAVPAVASAASWLKSWVATKVGRRDTVTFTDPVEPAPPLVVNTTFQPVTPSAGDIAAEVIRQLGDDSPLPTVEGELPDWADADLP